jgi:hypothetical protein
MRAFAIALGRWEWRTVWVGCDARLRWGGAMDDTSAIGSFVGVCYGFLENCDIAMTAA